MTPRKRLTDRFPCSVKRFCEPTEERRTWKIWFFDTTKQIIGCSIVHFINILHSEIFSGTLDPCTSYLISFLLDTSIGLLLVYVMIKLVLLVANKLDIQSLNFGYYGEPTAKIKYWLHQTAAYVLIVLLQKVIIILILQSYRRDWDQVKDLILYLMPNKNVEVFVVILFIPFIVNIWVRVSCSFPPKEFFY